MTATNKTDRDRFLNELCAEFDLHPTQIRFDERGEPKLDFEALQIVTHALCKQIQQDSVEPARIAEEGNYVTCLAHLILVDGREVRRYGFASLGESLGEDRIETIGQAVKVASARAYKQALRGIGFNPLRAWRLHQSGHTVKLAPLTTNSDNRSRELHALATQLGYINGSDRRAYRDLLHLMYGKRSSTQLNEDELAELITFLRGHLNRKTREREMEAQAA
ncbi:MAG TPA: hypothetical protein PLD20_00810 [Blastocatellia bacterium]|nr:hypothetical protein [Blastocatellia bacterium]HMV81787.1 hypothetical protein [Blastocatellia bacterium]HMX24733.1 hypothetical protein [Blastocatellia bacterium]HMY70686.1 hypothetical protein [Blastocatellia bacterium]HMZ16475.1 hypothetical protein [Blastocatellia bacterium]